MLKRIFFFFLLTFVVSCSETSSMNQMQYGDQKTTNFVELVTSIEVEEVDNVKYYYIDGSIDSATDISSVRLFCRGKSGKAVQEINGTYNSDRFSFTLPLTQGEYNLNIEITDFHGNKYIQKNISLQVK